MLNSHFKKQTEQIASYVRDAEERILDGLTSRLERIAAEMKQFGERVTIVKGEMAHYALEGISSVKQLDREVGELTTLRESGGGRGKIGSTANGKSGV